MKPSRDILVIDLLQNSLYDESGVACYTYGNMGEVTYTNHEIQGIRMRPSSRKRLFYGERETFPFGSANRIGCRDAMI